MHIWCIKIGVVLVLHYIILNVIKLNHIHKPSVYFESVTAVRCFLRYCRYMYQRVLQTLKRRRLTIYGKPYTHKISAVDIFFFKIFNVVMQCGPLLFSCTLYGVSSISGRKYILSKFSQPIRIK
jgi:hypothetical protein